MVDLNLLAPDSPLYLFTACSINSRGEIFGLALDVQGNFHGYLATPSTGAEGPSDEVLTAMQSVRFGHAWSLATQRMGSVFGTHR